MRITFVLSEATLAGGVRVVAIYAQRLQRRGHRVTVVSTPPRPPSLRNAWRRLKHGQWPLRSPRPSHLDGLAVEHRVLERYRPVCDADVPEADVVVATWWETAPWVAALSPRKGVKAYLIQHDERAMYPAREAEETRQSVAATWQLPMYRIVVAQWLARLLEEHVGPGASRVVSNGVDLTQFHAPPRGRRPHPTVGVMYSTVHFKGCDVALAAFEQARRTVPGLRLIAFGSEPPLDHLPLPDGAHFTLAPPQHRLRTIYALCDAWLFASRTEGFGLPLLEAMACRTPVIATPAGAAPELLGEGGGIMVGMDDPEAMAGAIVDIAGMSDDRWRTMSASAHETAAGHDWDHSVDLLESALMEAAGTTAVAPEREGGVVQR